MRRVRRAPDEPRDDGPAADLHHAQESSAQAREVLGVVEELLERPGLDAEHEEDLKREDVSLNRPLSQILPNKDEAGAKHHGALGALRQPVRPGAAPRARSA